MKGDAYSCRGCGQILSETLVDLGAMPLANSYIKPSQVDVPQAAYPLVTYVCTQCWLVQVPAVARPADIFSDYAYFSSFSDIWRAHCERYAQAMVDQLKLGSHSQVVEIASNDGVLLNAFQKLGVNVLGIEPAQNIAAYANEKGVPTRAMFFGAETADMLKREGISADLIVANNVLAHVPDIHDFVEGFARLLKPEGTITFEFPHLMEMLRETQFDTIYHEHYSYLSLLAVKPVFEAHGLMVSDVVKLPTHGGSLRVFVRHAGAEATIRVAETLSEERAFGLDKLAIYQKFGAQVRGLKTTLLETLQGLKAGGKRVAAYGAPAKGNTLLNYCGIDSRLVAYTVDKNPEKQGCLLPGSRLPVFAPEHILTDKPDVLFILPWNIADEVMEQMKAIREWGGRFLIAMPDVRLD